MANQAIDVEAIGVEAVPRLLEDLDYFAGRPLADRLLVVRQLAEQVREIHARGRTHRNISPDTIILDEQMRPRLGGYRARQRLGGDDSDPEICPPPLAVGEAIDLPDDAAVAARLLENNRFAISPERIDLYQLGVLLCRLVTGHSIRDYMISPTVKKLVPAAAQRCLARAIGFDAEDPYQDCDAFIAGLDETIRSAATVGLPKAMVDTLPSGLSVGSRESSSLTETGRSAIGMTPSRVAKADEPPFRELGGFQVLQRIGSGGMGDVYKAYDPSLDRVVALKVLPSELARDREFVKRFKSEAAAVARLSHPNIVPVYCTGEDAGHHFFAMRYVEGESLAALLQRQPCLPLDRSLEIAEQCLGGLAAAHAEGLIHRDIKPGNILIERDAIDHRTGRAVLIDFGLVRQMHGGAPLTAPGTVMGTAECIAPEQAQGKTVDGRADLYAIGVVMYRSLAGRFPFSGETALSVTYQHAHATAPLLGELAPGVPPHLAHIVARLMNKEPAERYQTAAEVLADLRAFRKGDLDRKIDETTTDRVVPVTRPARSSRRRLWPWVAGASAIAAAIAFGVIQWSGLLGSGAAPQEASQKPSDDSPPPAGNQQVASDDKPKGQTAAAAVPLVLKPGQELPKGKWVDVMKAVDLDWDTVSGLWRKGAWDGLSGTWRPQGTELTVAPGLFQRIMLPVELEGSYELKTEFTRISGIRSVDIVFPVGKRTCALTLAVLEETAHGLSLVDGNDGADRNNAAVWRPGRLVNRQRYPVLISVQLTGDKAKIEVSLDNHLIISWSGRQESLDIDSVWALPKSFRPALACNTTDIVYHSAQVRAMGGKARMAPPHVSPAIDLNDSHWVDMLKEVNPDRDAIQGRWLKSGSAVSVARSSEDESFVRLMLPHPVEGSYDLLAEFTRTKGTDSIGFALPVGTRQCMLHFSAAMGSAGGLELIDGRALGDCQVQSVRRPGGPGAPAPVTRVEEQESHNPGVRQPSGLVNGKRYQVLAQVRTHDGNAVIDIWLDGKPFVHWAGHQSSLELSNDWSLPERWHAGIGAKQSGVMFHSVRVRPAADGAAPVANQ